MTFRRPFLIAAAVVLACCVITAAFLISQSLMSHAENEVLASLEQAVRQTALNVDDRMASVAALSTMIVSDSRFQTSVWRTPGNETMSNQLKDIKQLRELVSTTMARQDIALVRFYISGVKMLSREHVNFYPVGEVANLPEYDDSRVSGYWYKNHFVSTLGYRGEALSYCTRVFDSRLWTEMRAFLVLDADTARFREVLAALTLPGDAGSLFIVDERGNIMLADVAHPVGDELARRIGQESAPYGFLQGDDRELTYIRSGLTQSGWTLAAVLPREALLSGSRMWRSALFAVIIALLLISVLAAFALSFTAYARSVRRQISSINHFLSETGHTSLDQTAKTRDTFRLNRSINELLETAAHATEEAYDARLRERDAVLRALQAQINPHFLYNTLDTINWMAMDAGAKDVSRMIETLGCYYRMSLSKGKDIVRFSEECAIVRAYLELQSERFDHEFDILWRIDAAAADCLLPKLTLQPLVENALLHGLRNRKEATGALLEIAADVRDGMLIITVCDNGPGLSDESAPTGYGLTNVRQRLELFTSGQYTVTLENRPDGGVLARMTLPA